MGVGGSKGGINNKLEKHRKKQLSKRKPLFGKIIGNEHLEGENTNFVTQRHHPRASPPSIEAADPEHPLAGGVEPDTSSRSVGSSQESHLERVTTPDIPSAPSRYRESGEFQPNLNSSQDTLSRELALTSSPHYKSSEFLTGTEDSFFGEDTKFHKLHNPEFATSPNIDSNLNSERYSLNNALDSQEYADISSSVDDVDCADRDLSDSGCHASEMAATPFSTGPVIKVRLDLNKVKYVGLNLVGGIDSPFGELPVLVKAVMPGGSGELSGIRSGDEIIGINNVSLENKTLQFAVERLRQCSSRDQEIILWVIKKADSC